MKATTNLINLIDLSSQDEVRYLTQLILGGNKVSVDLHVEVDECKVKSMVIGNTSSVASKVDKGKR